MPINEYRAQVARTADEVRARHFNGRDPVLSGAFDRFIAALARITALDLHAEFGNDPNVSISDLEHWHGTRHDAITKDKFAAMCSAHGIPQEIIIEFSISGRDHFDTVFKQVLMQSFGWMPVS